MERLEKMVHEKRRTDKERKEEEERFRRIAVLHGDWIEEMEESDGFKLVLEEYIKTEHDQLKRILGTRPGKLMWMQGFTAALDGLKEFINQKKATRDQVIKEDYESLRRK